MKLSDLNQNDIKVVSQPPLKLSNLPQGSVSLVGQLSDGLSGKTPTLASSLIDGLKGIGNVITAPARATGALATGAAKIATDIAKPFIQPFAMATGKDIKLPFDTNVKATPSPTEALGEAASTALLVAPVEKVIAPVLKPVANLLGGIIKRFGGTLTGKGLEVIDEIIANPEAAKIGLRGEETSVLKNLANEAKATVSKLNTEKNQAYKKAIESLPKVGETQITKGTGEPIYYTPLNKSGLKTFVTKALNEAGVIVNRAKEALSFTESPFSKSEENILKDVFNVVNKWTDMSPAGVDRLAVKIGNYQKAGEQSKFLNSVIGGLKKDVRNYIGDRYPQIANQVAEYAKSSDTINALQDILNISPLRNTSEMLDTAKKIQGLFKGDKQLERSLLKEMGMGDIVGTEAGRQLAQAPARAAASIGDTAKGLIQTVINPKWIGEIAAGAGIAKEKLTSLLPVLQKLAPAERTALFNFLSSLTTGTTGQSNQLSPRQ